MPSLETLLKPHPRVRIVREGIPAPDGRCVVYWMQRAQRGRDNAALNLAVALGNELKQPVVCVFGMTADYPGAQRRHYRFLVEGLVDAAEDLAARNVPLVVRIGEPSEVVPALVPELAPSIVIGDENPIRVGQRWREAVADSIAVPFRVVDADVVVPTSLLPKEEYAARTLRPKIHRLWDEFLKPLPNPKAKVEWTSSALPKGEAIDPDALLRRLKVGGVAEVSGYRGGAAEASR
ncbi:deoxyribodipyrimidine photo-lyase [Singulisphaera rosea]